MKRLITLALVICMLFTVAGCGGSESSNGAANEEAGGSGSSNGEIVVNVNRDYSLITLNPFAQNKDQQWQYAEMVYDALLASDHGGNYDWEICESYEMAEDGLSAVLKIAEGATFRDGSVCDANDVYATFQFIIDNFDTCANLTTCWDNLKSVELIDENTIKINMSYASHLFDNALSMTYIMSADDLEEYGDKLWSEGPINGTGPWHFVEWVDGQYTKYTRNDDYWKGQKSNIDTLYIWYMTEANTIASALISGDLDYAPNFTYDTLAMVEGVDGLEVTSELTATLNYMQFSFKEGSVFRDPKVRRAAVEAIDREALLELAGGGVALNCSYPVDSGGYLDEAELPYIPYDPENAEKLLSESSYNGEEIQFKSLANRENIVVSIAAYMEAAGFNVNITLEDSASFATTRSSGNYDMFYVGVAGWDGDNLPQYLSPRILNDCHSSYYVNEEMNELILKADAESDPEKRNAILEDLNRLQYQELAPLVGLFQPNGYIVKRDGLENITTSNGYSFYRYISVDPDVWGK